MSKSFRIIASTGTDKGDRDYQQDRVELLTHPRVNGCVLAIVADGMGGRSGGRKASDQVIMTAGQVFERYDPATDDAASFLENMVQEAHLVIRLTAISAEQEPHSTIAAFLVNPGAIATGCTPGIRASTISGAPRWRIARATTPTSRRWSTVAT